MSLEEVAKRIELAEYDTRQVEPGSREKLLDRVAWDAYYNDRVYEGCSRSVLQAPQRHLHLGDGRAVKASTALAGGGLPAWVRTVGHLPAVSWLSAWSLDVKSS